VRTRSATEADIPQLIYLWERCGLTRPWNDAERDIRFALQGPASALLIAEDDEQLVASVMVGQDGHRGSIYYLSVSPDHRGQGLGRIIHSEAVNWLRAQGVWKINLLVRMENAEVAGFYERLGYEQNPVLSFGLRIEENGAGH
jgi:ribosomal protein S18 acetylase RimI-like enzyme